MRPHGRQPTRLPRPWDSPGKNTGVGCDFLLQCMKVKSESEIVKAIVFPVVMYGYESWTKKKRVEHWKIDAFELLVLEKTFKNSSDSKDIKPVNPKGNQSLILIGRTDAEAEALILWPLDAKIWLIWKDPYAEKDWRQETKRATEDEVIVWCHWLNGHGFEQAPGDSEGQGSLCMLQSMESQRVGHDWATEQQQLVLAHFFLVSGKNNPTKKFFFFSPLWFDTFAKYIKNVLLR